MLCFAVISYLYGLTSDKICMWPPGCHLQLFPTVQYLMKKHNVAGLALGRTFPVLKADVS